MTELIVGGHQSDTHQKTLRINLDPRWYGTIAEIGAGQEVVRWFFRVGGAAGTVAKSISAYDMAVSDAVYGKADRYVSVGRLQGMLDKEFQLNVERLGDERGDSTAGRCWSSPRSPCGTCWRKGPKSTGGISWPAPSCWPPAGRPC